MTSDDFRMDAVEERSEVVRAFFAVTSSEPGRTGADRLRREEKRKGGKTMTQLLQTAIEEALKQSPPVQNEIAATILKSIGKARKKPRPIGLADGQVNVPDSFFDDLPEDELASWSGGRRCRR